MFNDTFDSKYYDFEIFNNFMINNSLCLMPNANSFFMPIYLFHDSILKYAELFFDKCRLRFIFIHCQSKKAQVIIQTTAIQCCQGNKWTKSKCCLHSLFDGEKRKADSHLLSILRTE